jgi:histone H2A
LKLILIIDFNLKNNCPYYKMSEDRKRSTRKPKRDSFQTYIYKVLKQVHPDTGITGNASGEIDLIIKQILFRLIEVSNVLLSVSKRKTVTAREIQSAVRLILPGELAKHAVSEGTRSLVKYNERAISKEKRSRQFRAGLQFSVSRVETILTNNGISDRKSASAAVFLAAVVEYLTAEILELSGNIARDSKRVRINTRHITLAVRNDDELGKFLNKKTTILSGGVVPFIHAPLLPPRAKSHPKE